MMERGATGDPLRRASTGRAAPVPTSLPTPTPPSPPRPIPACTPFCSGVPDSSRRRAAVNLSRSRASLDCRSFMRCASSITMYCHATCEGGQMQGCVGGCRGAGVVQRGRKKNKVELMPRRRQCARHRHPAACTARAPWAACGTIPYLGEAGAVAHDELVGGDQHIELWCKGGYCEGWRTGTQRGQHKATCRHTASRERGRVHLQRPAASQHTTLRRGTGRPRAAAPEGTAPPVHTCAPARPCSPHSTRTARWAATASARSSS